MALIEVRDVYKTYRVTQKEKGLRGAFKGLFRPDRREVEAVKDLNFSIEAGEIVGFIGPNGAGKSTTIKMLSGILHPTSGRLAVDGMSPQEDRKSVVQNIGVVFGQRTQLYWDLRLGESFELFKRIYRIGDSDFEEMLGLLNEVLQIDELVDTPVRQLSLGQRMRGELAAAMLHSPDILFLDEPTIGLDIEVKQSIRHFIREINRIRNVTVLLTTHDLDDVEALCERLIIIHQGEVIEDGALADLVTRVAPYRYLVVECEEPLLEFSHAHAEILKREENLVWVRFVKDKVTASQMIHLLSEQYKIKDVRVQEPDIEDVIRTVYDTVRGEDARESGQVL